MALFKSRSPADLKMLKGGMCPECGAAVKYGMKACGVCKVSFSDEHAEMLPGKPAPRAANAPLIATPARPLTPQEFDDLERSPLGHRFPISAAGAPDVYDGSSLALGAALSAALIAYADAALVDDVEVLQGRSALRAPITRALINVPQSSAALLADGEGPAVVSLFGTAPGAAPVAAPAPRAPIAAPAPPAPPVAAAPPPPVAAPAPPVAAPVPPAPPVAAAPPPPQEPVTAVDPDATLVHNANDIAGIIEGIARKNPNVAASGRARTLDDG